jgi:SNF2 family DNA or RNA helicase
MIILHGTWFSKRKHILGKFGFWAEDLSKPLSKCTVETISPIKKRKPEHPFQLSTDEVVTLLSSLYAQMVEKENDNTKTVLSQQKPITRWRTLQIPTRNNYPIVSKPVIISEDNTSNIPAAVSLKPWRIRHIELSASDSLLFLSKFPMTQKDCFEEDIIGDDIRFWSATAKFGLELLCRQRFIPQIVNNDERLYAQWIPVFNDPFDAKRIDLLAEMIPPICFSEMTDISQNPKDLVTDFLITAVDELIKQWLFDYLDTSTSVGDRLRWKDNLASFWLNGLTTIHHKPISCSSHQKRILADSLMNWSKNIQGSTENNGWRTCFRLEEPLKETEPSNKKGTQRSFKEWQITFHIQSKDDKSLLLPAEHLWANNIITGEEKIMDARFNEERFLMDLHHASQLYTPIGKSLTGHLPTCCTIDSEQAYMFLKEGAWFLKECGYGVFVPSWWNYQKQQSQLGLRLKVNTPKKGSSARAGFFTLDHLVDFQWEIAIGDDIIPTEEFQQLAKMKTPLVNVRGKWVEMNDEQVNAAMNFLHLSQQKGMTLAESLHIGLGQKDVGLPVVGFDTDDLLKGFISGGKHASFSELGTPEGFRGILRPYQKRGYSWLSFLSSRGIGACLADDMGLGKTIQLISLLLTNKQQRKDMKNRSTTRPVLLICPTSVVGNWKHELERFSPSLFVMIHHGSDRQKGKGLVKQVKENDIVISTYALAHRDEKILKKIKWDGIVLDEAQNIKNPSTKQTQAIRGLQSRYRIALTGTPMENRLDELWSIMEFLNPGYLGSLKEFKKRFIIPIERYSDKKTSETLKNLIHPFILRRLKTDKSIIDDLPMKHEMNVYYTLTKEQATLYQATVNDMMQQIEQSDGMKRRGLVLSTLLRLKQICNHPVLFLQDNSSIDKRSGKLSRFMEIIEELLSEKDSALIFTQFVTMGAILQEHLTNVFGREVLFLHGGISRKKRDEMIKRFQDEKEGVSLFILSLKAGGFGLNLTKANHIFHFDRWWNPAVEDQATDRAFRIGQKRNVQVHKFVCLGTLEERINEMLEYKKGLADSILGSGETWLTELSNKQLRDLFTLRLEEVQEDEVREV